MTSHRERVLRDNPKKERKPLTQVEFLADPWDPAQRAFAGTLVLKALRAMYSLQLGGVTEEASSVPSLVSGDEPPKQGWFLCEGYGIAIAGNNSRMGTLPTTPIPRLTSGATSVALGS